MVLIGPAIGIKELTSHNKTPIIMRVTIILTNGIIYPYFLVYPFVAGVMIVI